VVNIQVGKLIVVGEQDGEWVQRLGAADVVPQPLQGLQQISAETIAAALPAGADRLPMHRLITAADRLLLWAANSETDDRARPGGFSDPVVAHALAAGADVWLVSDAYRARAAELVEVLGVTLCAGGSEPGTPGSVSCQNAAGEVLEHNRTGWLVWAGTELDPARSAGYIDPHGWVHILGAAAQTMVVEDGLLTPFEGAACLATHPRVTRACQLLLSVSQCAVAGLERGFYAVAEVTGHLSPVLEVELLDYVRRGVSAPKCPQGIVCVAELPTTQTGAADTAALMDLVAAQFELLPAG